MADRAGDGEVAGGPGVAVPVDPIGTHHLHASGSEDTVVEPLARGRGGVEAPWHGGEGNGGEAVVGIIIGRVGIGAGVGDVATVEAVGHAVEEGVGAAADGGRGGAPLVNGGGGEGAAEGRLVDGRPARRHIDVLHNPDWIHRTGPALGGGGRRVAQEGDTIEGIAGIEGLSPDTPHRGGYHLMLQRPYLQRGNVHRVQRGRQVHLLDVLIQDVADKPRRPPHRGDGVGVGAVAHGRGDGNPLADNAEVPSQPARRGRRYGKFQPMPAGHGGLESGAGLRRGLQPQRQRHRDGEQSDSVFGHKKVFCTLGMFYIYFNE